MPPVFSIIIPMFNRERFISRAIDSCLNQDFDNFEIIVVDDGSTDGSVEAVNKITDPRISFIGHNTNRGVGPARNTGIDKADGEWVICLDSDDELLPGALTLISKRINEIDKKEISRLQFMLQMDPGEISPDPPLKNEFWDYVKYLKWMEGCYGRSHHSFQVVRRAALSKVRYDNDRTLETPYHLNFMKTFNAWSFPDVVHIYHHDSGNQLTKPNVNRSIQYAGDLASSWDIMLKNHGEALKLHAPRIYNSLTSNLATLYFLSGNRSKGIRFSFSCLRNNFISPRHWAILLSGLLGAKPLAWLKFLRSSV